MRMTASVPIVVVLAYGLCAGTWALARRTVNYLLSQED
jgi:hypothetical protein